VGGVSRGRSGGGGGRGAPGKAICHRSSGAIGGWNSMRERTTYWRNQSAPESAVERKQIAPCPTLKRLKSPKRKPGKGNPPTSGSPHRTSPQVISFKGGCGTVHKRTAYGSRVRVSEKPSKGRNRRQINVCRSERRGVRTKKSYKGDTHQKKKKRNQQPIGQNKSSPSKGALAPKGHFRSALAKNPLGTSPKSQERKGLVTIAMESQSNFHPDHHQNPGSEKIHLSKKDEGKEGVITRRKKGGRSGRKV